MGLCLWRGNYAESELKDRAFITAIDQEEAWLTVPFPGGHGVLYVNPDFGGATAPGNLRVNWEIYAPLPKGQKLNGIESIPPGGVSPQVYDELS